MSNEPKWIVCNFVGKLVLCWCFHILMSYMIEAFEHKSLYSLVEKLSIVDKYFSLKKEWRINRAQFFVRNITGTLIGLTPIFIIGVLIVAAQEFEVIPVVHDDETLPMWALVITGIAMLMGTSVYYALGVNNCKRAHDFNHEGLWYNLMFYIGIFAVGIMIGLLIFIWAMMASGDVLLWASLGFAWGYISIYLAQMITWWILQFRKWNPGNNRYGPAPTGKPLA